MTKKEIEKWLIESLRNGYFEYCKLNNYEIKEEYLPFSEIVHTLVDFQKEIKAKS